MMCDAHMPLNPLALFLPQSCPLPRRKICLLPLLRKSPSFSIILESTMARDAQCSMLDLTRYGCDLSWGGHCGGAALCCILQASKLPCGRALRVPTGELASAPSQRAPRLAVTVTISLRVLT